MFYTNFGVGLLRKRQSKMNLQFYSLDELTNGVNLLIPAESNESPIAHKDTFTHVSEKIYSTVE
jgi:hypothetical protein